MFSDKTIEIITSLRFDPDAETVSCLLPLGSIFWSDELPRWKFLAFAEGPDRDVIMRLFAIRINYWNTGQIVDEDKSVWDAAKQQFPDWPFFRRLHLTAAQRREHESTQRQLENLFDELTTGADEFVFSEGPKGFSSFSATFNVGDE
jgi:hypothetical protein